MPGRVIAVDVALGDKVKKGKRLVVIEAMKMEQGLVAPFEGVITELKARVDAQVSEGALLARVEKGES
jgi:3-methylcrotonyl-CoA carboxylase alpha subunit